MASGAMANRSTQSAAVRRLAALVEQDEQEEAQRLAEQRLAEWDRAAAAQKAAEEAGVDPKTKQQVKYLAGKLSAWLEVHGVAAGYDAAMGPTVEVMRHFQSYCFVHRKNYSLLGNQGMGDSFGALQVPYLLPKYGFPLLQFPGWVGLDADALEMKCAPYKISLRSQWKELKVAHVLTEQEKLSEEQQRSLVKVKWDDRALSLAQDHCMRDVLRLNRACTRLAVMGFVRATTSRSGGFTKDWADRSGQCLQWLGRNVLNVYDFAWDTEGMQIEMPDCSVLQDAIAGEVDLHRVKFHYHEKRYVYPMAFTPDRLEPARRCATWMANYFWRRGLYEVQYSGMDVEARAACLAHRQEHGHAGGMPRGAQIDALAAAQRWAGGDMAYAPELVREPLFVRMRASRAKAGIAQHGWFTLEEMHAEEAGAVFSDLGDELAFKPNSSGINSGRRNSGVAVSKGLDAAGMSQLQAKKQFAHKAKSGVSTFETCYDDGSNTTDTGGLQMQRPLLERAGLKAISSTVTPALYGCRRFLDVAVDDPIRVRLYDDDTERSRYAVRLTANVELLQASQSTDGAEDICEMLQIKVSGLRKALRRREWRLQHEVLTEKRWQLFGYAFVHKKFERPALEDVSGLRLTEILSTFGSDIDRTCLLSAAERAHVVFTKQGALDRMREVLHVQVKQPSRGKKPPVGAKVTRQQRRQGTLVSAKLVANGGIVQLQVSACAKQHRKRAREEAEELDDVVTTPKRECSRAERAELRAQRADLRSRN